MIRITFDDSGVQQQLDIALTSVKDLTEVWQRYIAYRRKKVAGIFDASGPGWQPLAESTEEQRKERLDKVAAEIRSKASIRFGKKLWKEQKRAIKRSVKYGLAAQGLRADSKAGKTFARSQRTLERHRVIREQFEAFRAQGVEPSGKATKKLMERIGRSESRAEDQIRAYADGKQLGQIANSMKYEIEGLSMTEYSRIPWAGIHNKGGTAGNNANIPERRFLEIDAEDVTTLQKIAADVVASSFGKQDVRSKFAKR